MISKPTYKAFFSAFLLSAMIFVMTGISMAQQTDADSTRRTFFMSPQPDRSVYRPHSERSIGEFAYPESGIYEKPEETQYYTPPFQGQYYLDLAVQAYHEEQRDKLGVNWLFGFLNAIAPYVNNSFQFGVYRINDLPVVARDNPLFQSYKNREKIE